LIVRFVKNGVPNLEACIRTAEIERFSATEARTAEAPAAASSITRLLLSSFHGVLRVFKTLTLSAQQRLNCQPYRNADFHIEKKHRHTNCPMSSMHGDYLKVFAETPRLGTNNSY
jgi:hypothetical protein